MDPCRAFSGWSYGGQLRGIEPGHLRCVLLLAAYTTKEINEGMTVLSLYGSEDGVLNMDSVESGRDLVPEDYTEICIEGGNYGSPADVCMWIFQEVTKRGEFLWMSE